MPTSWRVEPAIWYDACDARRSRSSLASYQMAGERSHNCTMWMATAGSSGGTLKRAIAKGSRLKFLFCAKISLQIRGQYQYQTINSSGDKIANVNCLYDDIVHALQNTIDSCINSATDRRVYVLELGDVFETQCIYLYFASDAAHIISQICS